MVGLLDVLNLEDLHISGTVATSWVHDVRGLTNRLDLQELAS